MRQPALRVVPLPEPAARRLGEWARAAVVLESRAREALAILAAVRDSRLLVAPVNDADRERQMTGVALIEMIEVRLRDALAVYESPSADELRHLERA